MNTTTTTNDAIEAAKLEHLQRVTNDLRARGVQVRGCDSPTGIDLDTSIQYVDELMTMHRDLDEADTDPRDDQFKPVWWSTNVNARTVHELGYTTLRLPSLRELATTCARGSMESIQVAVVGYLSIVIYACVNVRREYVRGASDRVDDMTHAWRWEFGLSHTSGGRDTKAVPADDVAASNFGHALIAMGAAIRELRTKHVPTLQAIVDDIHAKEQAARDAAQAAFNARVEADAPCGEAVAKAHVALAVAYGCGAMITTYQRGKDDALTYSIDVTPAGAVRIVGQNMRHTRAQFVDMLAQRSHRVTVTPPVVVVDQPASQE